MARAPETTDTETAPPRPAGAHNVIPGREQMRDLARSSRQFRDEQNAAHQEEILYLDQDDPNRGYVGLHNPFKQGQERQGDDTPPEREPAAQPEPTPEPEPSAPAADAEPPKTAPDTAEPAAPAAAEPRVIQDDDVVELVVNGQTERWTGAELRKRGQKVAWADKYLEDVHALRDRLKQQGIDVTQQPTDQPAAQPQTQPSAPGGTPTPTREPAATDTPAAAVTPDSLGIDVKAVYDAIAFGDEASGVEQLNNAMQKIIDHRTAEGAQAHQLDPDEIAARAASTVQYNRMVADSIGEVNQKYDGFFNDPDAAMLADKRFRAIAREWEVEGRPFDFGAAFMQAADETAERLQIPQREPATPGNAQPTPTNRGGNRIADRQAAKRGMDTPPAAATGRVQTAPADQPTQGNDVLSQRRSTIERMAQQRGQHVMPPA